MASESTTPPVTSQPQLQPQASAQPPSATTNTTTSKTPVTLAPTAHLDPSAYVRGTHAIQIAPNTLIHPRVHLLSLHSPLTIGENSIICEKTILGGPLPATPTPSTTTSTTTSNETTITTDPTSSLLSPPPGQSAADNSTITTTSTTSAISSNPTTIGRHVHIHPNVTVHSGAKIQSFVVLEASATILHDVAIGRHSKICAGITVVDDVPEWTVVYGSDAAQKRRRRRQRGGTAVAGGADDGDDDDDRADGARGGGRDGNSGSAEVTEAERIKAMEREREGTVGILRAAAARVAASRGARR